MPVGILFVLVLVLVPDLLLTVEQAKQLFIFLAGHFSRAVFWQEPRQEEETEWMGDGMSYHRFYGQNSKLKSHIARS